MLYNIIQRHVNGLCVSNTLEIDELYILLSLGQNELFGSKSVGLSREVQPQKYFLLKYSNEKKAKFIAIAMLRDFGRPPPFGRVLMKWYSKFLFFASDFEF